MDNKFFFSHFGIQQRDLERYLAAALSAGGDYADLYFEYQTSTSLSLDESLVKSASQGISAGCGVRVISGERTGYAYTDDLAPERILRVFQVRASYAEEVRRILVVGSDGSIAADLQPLARFNVFCIAK